LIKKITEKSIFVQLNFFSFDSEFIDMTVLTDSLTHDLLLEGIADVETCMQNVYMSGCDFVSFFRGYGKKRFFDSFRKNADFISSNLAGDGSDGQCSFYKLILCTYFSKHRAAFQPAVSVQELVTKLSTSDKSENSTNFC
jgi:hypothetical protein